MAPKRFPLTVILILAVIIWGGTLHALGIDLSWDYFKPYTYTLSALTILITAFDQMLWRYWPIRLFVKMPDLNGTWRVSLHSTYADGPIRGYAVVRQTYSMLSIRILTNDSSSALKASNVLVDPDQTYEIVGVYQSDPAIHLRGAESEIHYGSFKIRLVGSPVSSMKGHYWTDRNTKGRVEYTDRQRKHADSFESAERLFG